MVDESVSVAILNSLISRFKSQKDEAIATIMVYLRNPVGVGEHPGILDELDTLFAKAADADEKLIMLETNFKLLNDDNRKAQT